MGRLAGERGSRGDLELHPARFFFSTALAKARMNARKGQNEKGKNPDERKEKKRR